MKLNLKVFVNKANGQARVHIPKKMFEELPKDIDVTIPDKFLKVKIPEGKWKKW